jgi:hypothetical protein
MHLIKLQEKYTVKSFLKLGQIITYYFNKNRKLALHPLQIIISMTANDANVISTKILFCSYIICEASMI